MENSLLLSLREQVLDDSNSLSSLLRKCLALGRETDSSALSDWARNELFGYESVDQCPEYRRIGGLIFRVNSTNGFTFVSNQMVNYVELPASVRKFLPDTFNFQQPIDELELMAERDQFDMSNAGVGLAKSVLNKELEWGQRVTLLTISFSGTAIAGILGQVRSRLVDLVFTISSDIPLTELPRTVDVDAAVDRAIYHNGDVYKTTVSGSSGPVSVGRDSSAVSTGASIDEILKLLDTVKTGPQGDADEHSKELVELANELHDELSDEPNKEKVVPLAKRLQAAAERVATSALSSAASTAASSTIGLFI